MARGISLHIGVDRVDPKHYDGWEGRLEACEADAEDLRELADGQGFDTQILLTADATRGAVLVGIARAARSLVAGDIFFLSYSGHGGQVPDFGGEEEDLKDETWCLHDAQLLDDELWEAWSGFQAGVRVLLLSDSCHSGTVVRAPASLGERATLTAPAAALVGGSGPARYRFMPEKVARCTFRAHRAFYRDLSRGLPQQPSPVTASVRLISGCQDDQFSLDGTFNGLFTGTLKEVWDGGAFEGDYGRFYREILLRMPSSQSPNHLVLGQADPAYDAQRPFTI